MKIDAASTARRSSPKRIFLTAKHLLIDNRRRLIGIAYFGSEKKLVNRLYVSAYHREAKVVTRGREGMTRFGMLVWKHLNILMICVGLTIFVWTWLWIRAVPPKNPNVSAWEDFLSLPYGYMPIIYTNMLSGVATIWLIFDLTRAKFRKIRQSV
jgi:hypothetical protein